MVRTMRRNVGGFTVIELLVVLAVIALLAAVAVPRYTQHVGHAREVALRENLLRLRQAIDHFHVDQARYPATLAELVERRYLRAVPIDPITERVDTWRVVAPTAPELGAVFDVRSGAAGAARDGTAYASW
jgi:general secretion pathway protein G